MPSKTDLGATTFKENIQQATAPQQQIDCLRGQINYDEMQKFLQSEIERRRSEILKRDEEGKKRKELEMIELQKLQE